MSTGANIIWWMILVGAFLRGNHLDHKRREIAREAMNPEQRAQSDDIDTESFILWAVAIVCLMGMQILLT